MAQASGAAIDGLLPGEFTHAASGVHYRLFLRDGRAWLSYDRPNAPPEYALKGEQELTYFVGSGQRGRTYLFQRDGYWFVSWFSPKENHTSRPSPGHSNCETAIVADYFGGRPSWGREWCGVQNTRRLWLCVSRPFLERNDLIRRHAGKRFISPAWPADFNRCDAGGAA